jgi:hypothetical protein
MKQKVIALAAVVFTISLTISSLCLQVGAQTSYSLIGYWGSAPNGAGDNQIDFFSDGSYRLVKKNRRNGIHSYSLSRLTVFIGNFTINGSTVVLYPLSVQVTEYPFDNNGIALAPVVSTSNMNANTYVTLSASFINNGQTLVLSDGNGEVLNYSKINSNFAL